MNKFDFDDFADKDLADHFDGMELVDVARAASTALQNIQDRSGRNNTTEAQVKFPRGFLRTAKRCRLTLPEFGDEVQQRNASYALMTLDVYRWLLTRTALTDPVRNLIFKQAIGVFGSLCELFLNGAIKGKSYPKKTEKLVAKNIIDEALKCELNWVWDQRNHMHLDKATEYEIDMYTLKHYKRAWCAYKGLRDSLLAHQNKLEAG